MPKRQKKPPKYPWLTKIISYRSLSIPLGNWLLILLALLMLTIPFVLVGRASTVVSTETFVAEVDERWNELYVNKRGVNTNYYVRLRRGEEEKVTCAISPILVHLWHGLEVGRKYEFSANHTLTGCRVYEVVEIDEPGDSEF
jgi:hypothetical protein